MQQSRGAIFDEVREILSTAQRAEETKMKRLYQSKLNLAVKATDNHQIMKSLRPSLLDQNDRADRLFNDGTARPIQRNSLPPMPLKKHTHNASPKTIDKTSSPDKSGGFKYGHCRSLVYSPSGPGAGAVDPSPPDKFLQLRYAYGYDGDLKKHGMK